MRKFHPQGERYYWVLYYSYLTPTSTKAYESDSVSFEVKWMDYAKVKVMKKDNVTNVNLAGAVFGIYSDKE